MRGDAVFLQQLAERAPLLARCARPADVAAAFVEHATQIIAFEATHRLRLGLSQKQPDAVAGT
jgi:hypothetical protein